MVIDQDRLLVRQGPLIKRRTRALRVSATERIARVIMSGGVFSYPTETVWALGCDMRNADAIRRLRLIKRRAVSCGFILIAGSWRQFFPYLSHLSWLEIKRICTPRSRPISWVVDDPFERISPLIKGRDNKQVAIRISSHSTVARITARLRRPILSTSANLAGMRPARAAAEVDRYFGTRIDCLVPGICGPIPVPSQIREIKSERVLRR